MSASVSAPAGCPGGILGAPRSLTCAPRPCQLGSRPQPSPSDSPMLLAKGTYFQRVRLCLLTACMGEGDTFENTGLRRSCLALPLPGRRCWRRRAARGPLGSNFSQSSPLKAGICLLSPRCTATSVEVHPAFFLSD